MGLSIISKSVLLCSNSLSSLFLPVFPDIFEEISPVLKVNPDRTADKEYTELQIVTAK